MVYLNLDTMLLGKHIQNSKTCQFFVEKKNDKLHRPYQIGTFTSKPTGLPHRF